MREGAGRLPLPPPERTPPRARPRARRREVKGGRQHGPAHPPPPASARRRHIAGGDAHEPRQLRPRPDPRGPSDQSRRSGERDGDAPEPRQPLPQRHASTSWLHYHPRRRRTAGSDARFAPAPAAPVSSPPSPPRPERSTPASRSRRGDKRSAPLPAAPVTAPPPPHGHGDRPWRRGTGEAMSADSGARSLRSRQPSACAPWPRRSTPAPRNRGGDERRLQRPFPQLPVNPPPPPRDHGDQPRRREIGETMSADSGALSRNSPPALHLHAMALAINPGAEKPGRR